MAVKLDIKKLFITAVSIKTALAALSVALGSPYICGLILPLLVMVLYIGLGIYKRDDSVSDEKFADSCYYLGFIFTIASIIASLFDLHNIGSGLGDVAARFGAAMISTCLGVIVRVVLVSFRQNAEDALKNVEDSVLTASRRLTDEFSRSFDQLVVFRSEAVEASRIAVAGVKEQIDSMSEAHRQEIETFFSAMTEHNKTTILGLIQDVRTASMGLNRILEQYQERASETSEGIDKTLQSFITTLIERLTAVEFPPDIFSSRLEAPIAQLNGTTADASNSVKLVSEHVKSAAKSVSTTVDKINTKAESLSEVLSTAQALSAEQQELLFAIKRQQQAVIDQLQAYQEEMLKGFSAQQESMLGKLHEHADLIADTNGVMSKLVDQIGENREVAEDFHKAWLGMTQVANEMAETVKGSMEKLTPAIVSIEEMTKRSVHDSRSTTTSVESLSSLMVQLLELNKTQLDRGASTAYQPQSIAELNEQMQALNANLQQLIANGDKYSALDAAVENSIAAASQVVIPLNEPSTPLSAS
ncbi:hypothetical protein A9179_12745 [Pseudomonas alcaligenes]|uniref:MotA/TolQ/ExbB proton channel domain-containing protein n=1 Tax=Aquipseudomonas alcaligenes TaxID=43263 RepID=A0ABR7S3I6_AQUAC|nr:hypothetical protein [Pseudomonas alcaligenes]MBC9251146.1 hypothetical protein [Pseudomonas alcaligenes]